jgi:hypothetical protein
MLFLLGPPRSGGELVRDALATFSDVQAVALPTRLFSDGFLRLWVSSQHKGRDGIGRLAPEAAFLHALRGLADAIFVEAAGDSRLLAEYTSEHALVLDIMRAVYPDALFVAVRRDGRAVTQDLVHGPHRSHRFAIVAARHWVEAERALMTVPVDHRVELETLLTDPVVHLRRLADALQLQPSVDELEAAAGVIAAARSGYATRVRLAARSAAEAVGASELAARNDDGPTSGLPDRLMRATWRATSRLQRT